jgi:anti-sigma regulatory factor (Ser/Thr protein kinase)
MLRVEIAIDLAAIETAQDRIADWLAGEGVAHPVVYRVRLVLEELLTNLVMHGRFPRGRAPARVALEVTEGEVEVTIEDAAEPFDPRGAADPALPPSLDDDRLGGLGLALVRRMADIRAYGRGAGGVNLTRLRVRAETKA